MRRDAAGARPRVGPGASAQAESVAAGPRRRAGSRPALPPRTRLPRTCDVLKKSGRRFFVVFGLWGPSPGPGTVKKRLRMQSWSRGSGRDFRGPRPEKNQDIAMSGAVESSLLARPCLSAHIYQRTTEVAAPQRIASDCIETDCTGKNETAMSRAELMRHAPVGKPHWSRPWPPFRVRRRWGRKPK